MGELVAGGSVPDVPDAIVEAVLKEDRYAETARVRLSDGSLAIWKRSVVVVPPGVRVAAAARRLAAREADHLERLADVPGIPALLGRPSPDTFLRRWIEGADLRQVPEIPDRVFPELRELLAAVHARGVAYADLAKEENILVEDAGPGHPDTGHVWLVDFQISVAEGTWLGGLVPLLQRADRVHLARHVKRRRPDQLDDADREALAKGKGWLSQLHRTVVKKPYNLVTRRLIRRWSGAGEGRRDGEPRGMRDVR
jgi:hypothetical protein